MKKLKKESIKETNETIKEIDSIDKIFVEKQNIRNSILFKRNSISKHELLMRSKLIEQKLFLLPEFKKAKTVSIFVSKGNEVFSHNLIRQALFLGKKVVVPFVGWEKNEMLMCEISSMNDLVQKRFGLFEPRNPKPFSISKIDLILMPGVAFDESKNRIGYGKGFYDRFLAKFAKDSKSGKKVSSIALAFDFQVLKKIPTTKTDVKVGKILTESRII